MPVDPRPHFTFEFTEDGKMRLLNTDKSLEFLREVDKHEDLQIVLGAQTSPPNLTQDCGEGKPPQPLKVSGCLNEICPVSIQMKLTPLIQKEWTRTMLEGGGGA